MPMLGADMESGTLVEWKVKPGDTVKRGDIVAVVETVKGAIEVEIFEDGVVESLLVAPGSVVPVGGLLAMVKTAEGPSVAPRPEERRRISPVARKLAEELGVDLAQVSGSGPDGAITRADVEKAAPRLPLGVSGVEPRARPAASMREAIAAAMSRSKREIPHYYLGTRVDVGAALAWLKERNAQKSMEERLLPAALFLKAVARAVKTAPELNGTWVEGAFRPSEAVHLGVAISLRAGGLVAPALHHADRLSLPELMKNLMDLVSRARAGKLKSSELSDPTLTVTNLGDLGVETVYPVIYPPQVAIVGLGRVVEQPWTVGGQVVSRPVLTATLAADHRVSDGHRGGLFLTAFERLLQEPASL